MSVLDRLRGHGFLPPDAHGRSLTNLLASVIRSRGGVSPHASFSGLDEARLAEASRMVLLIVDGLGWGQVQHAREALASPAFLDRTPERATTVFPATTAVATTTLVTGAAPIEHAILGWYLHLPELGMNTTILLGTNRLEMPAAPPDFAWRRILDLPSHADTMTQPRTLISFGKIPWSGYSMACARWDHRMGVESWAELESAVLRFASGAGPGFAYVYWPAYDSACHDHGVHAVQTLDELRTVDCGLARLHDQLARRGVALVVTADHGLMDTRPLDPLRQPGWLETQATLPAGDARHLACFVRSGREAEFLELTRSFFGERALVVRGADLAAEGVFGAGPEHRSFRARLGDWIILLKPGWHAELGLPGSKPSGLVGTHGGMSPAEMEVPVFSAGALA